MIKYIDAELLKKGLKELESVIYSNELVGQSMHPYDCGQLHAIKVVKELINSLQQEQPCEDFEKEWDEFEDWMGSYSTSDYPTYYEPKQIARHFYILGLKNNIPVTQITLDELAKEEEPVSKDLKEEYKDKDWGILRDMSIGEYDED